MPKKVYMACTADKYELPIAIFDNLQELSNWSNKSKNTCKQAIVRKSKDKNNNCYYEKIIMEQL